MYDFNFFSWPWYQNHSLGSLEGKSHINSHWLPTSGDLAEDITAHSFLRYLSLPWVEKMPREGKAAQIPGFSTRVRVESEWISTDIVDVVWSMTYIIPNNLSLSFFVKAERCHFLSYGHSLQICNFFTEQVTKPRIGKTWTVFKGP